MTTVVVFGSAGFLGRRLVHRLTAEGMTVGVAVRHERDTPGFPGAQYPTENGRGGGTDLYWHSRTSLIGVQRSMTTRPRVFPARTSAAKAGTSSSLARDVMLLSFPRSRSVARRPQASSRFSRGVKTEFTPARVTSRRMKGRTVAGRSDPYAKPQAATAPSYLICESTLARVRLPSESTAPAQRSLANGTPAPESSPALMISSAPSPCR